MACDLTSAKSVWMENSGGKGSTALISNDIDAARTSEISV